MICTYNYKGYKLAYESVIPKYRSFDINVQLLADYYYRFV